MTTFLQPNPASGVPVYQQLVAQVKDALGSGALRPGDLLPGVRPLAEALVINPNAVARAYRELERERIVFPSRRRGRRVRARAEWPDRAGRHGCRHPGVVVP